MKRSVFFSFHYVPDAWRTSQIRNIGMIEGNRPASDNDWEKIKGRGDKAIQDWIDGQLRGRSCTIVLIGTNTSKRDWVKYEIEKSWNLGKGVLGIYIHKLKDSFGKQSIKGENPFNNFTINGKKMSAIVKAYDSPYLTSTYVYNHIKDNIENWIEEAIEIRDSNL